MELNLKHLGVGLVKLNIYSLLRICLFTVAIIAYLYRRFFMKEGFEGEEAEDDGYFEWDTGSTELTEDDIVDPNVAKAMKEAADAKGSSSAAHAAADASHTALETARQKKNAAATVAAAAAERVTQQKFAEQQVKSQLEKSNAAVKLATQQQADAQTAVQTAENNLAQAKSDGSGKTAVQKQAISNAQDAQTAAVQNAATREQELVQANIDVKAALLARDTALADARTAVAEYNAIKLTT